jgi:hypothetical protein
MRLTDLAPRWTAQEGRHGQGIVFQCPLHPDVDGDTVGASFRNPIDGGTPYFEQSGWDRSGDTFETLTLTPSIAAGFCFGWDVGEIQRPGWHGFITNGEVTNA